jgi:Cu-Zn family superoxide dismutase
MAPPDVVVANVPLVRSDGASIGTVRVFQENTGVVLRIDANGLPQGIHGVHLHAVGRCDAPGFTSAGPHWNPTNRKHGHRNPEGFHAGDLGNLGVGADGKLVAGLLVPGATLAGLRDAAGAALVFHARADDEMTDPSGNSGDRIACAVL